MLGTMMFVRNISVKMSMSHTMKFTTCLNVSCEQYFAKPMLAKGTLLSHCNLKSLFKINSSGLSSAAINAKFASDMDKHILLDYYKGKGIILLNRPKSLNALTYQMAEKIEACLKEWNRNSQIVLIKSTSEKAFCAGGDVKATYEDAFKSPGIGRKHFRLEYTLNNLIGSMSVPYVAIINGIVMGGGCGLSLHGNYRIVTENAIFAMPETAIGHFPDVGASHFLNRLPGALGLYLGLTGKRLSGRSMVKLGLGTHFVNSNKLLELEQELLDLDAPSISEVDKVLQNFQVQKQDMDDPKDSWLVSHFEEINNIFGGAQQVEDIVRRLAEQDSDWARKQLRTLARMSPTSLKLTFELLRRTKTMSLSECLMMEYRIACRIIENKDFFEGSRALLIERDNEPRWNPARLELCQESYINSYFERLPDGEELILN